MRRSRVLALLLACAFLPLSCAEHLWSTPREVVPRSYQRALPGAPRSIGRLRRLILPLPRCEIVRDGKRLGSEEHGLAVRLRDLALAELRDERGYDVLPPEVLLGAEERPDLSEEELASLVDRAARWALESPDGASPPEDVAAAVRRLAGAWNADGILLLQVHQRYASTWNVVLVMLTASLSWPLLVIEARSETRADLFEAASGEIVWRRSRREIDRSREDLLVGDVLAPIEPALPAAMVVK